MGRPTCKRASGRRFASTLCSPVFVASAVVLAAAALGLRPAVRALAVHYAKEPIAIRRPLVDLDLTLLPSFRRVAGEVPPSVTPVDLGTEEFTWLALADESTEFRHQSASLFVTYYSNPRDKVPHTPEVCYRQQGTEVTGLTTDTLETPGLGPDTPSITIRVMQIHHPEPPAWGVLAYVFCANGKFCHDREQVRWIIGWPGDRYTYFSKIEVAAQYSPEAGPMGEAQALRRAKRLLSEVLPVLVEQHFPTRDQVAGDG